MDRKKILFILPNLNGGGAERVIVNIVNILDIKIFDVYILIVQNKGVYFDKISKDVKIKVLNYRKVIFSLFGVKNIIKDINPDLIFSTTHRMNFIVLLSSKMIFKNYKTALRLPNSPKLEIQNQQISKTQRLLYKYAYTTADFVIAQTPEMKKEIKDYFNVDEDRIKVLLNPIDEKLIDASVLKSTNPFNQNYINVVAAGRLTHQKGFDILITSFRDVINNNNNFRLYIIGKDSTQNYKDKLIKLVSSLNLTSYITFLGFQENPYQYFYFSNLYVLSSRWEGLPNTVLENLYLNKPIVATKCIPYMNKLIENKKTGLLVDVENSKQLANAILNYKAIKPNQTRVNKDNIDSFFTKIIKE